jgi:hypothetical protein
LLFCSSCRWRKPDALSSRKASLSRVGRWRFFHTDGTPFTARLAPDQSAATDWEGGEHGIWRWEGSTVRVTYTDGWDDQLVQTASGVLIKRGWSPEADRCGPASNQTGAERISSDPGPPL